MTDEYTTSAEAVDRSSTGDADADERHATRRWLGLIAITLGAVAVGRLLLGLLHTYPATFTPVGQTGEFIILYGLLGAGVATWRMGGLSGTSSISVRVAATSFGLSASGSCIGWLYVIYLYWTQDYSQEVGFWLLLPGYVRVFGLFAGGAALIYALYRSRKDADSPMPVALLAGTAVLFLGMMSPFVTQTVWPKLWSAGETSTGLLAHGCLAGASVVLAALAWAARSQFRVAGTSAQQERRDIDARNEGLRLHGHAVLTTAVAAILTVGLVLAGAFMRWSTLAVVTALLGPPLVLGAQVLAIYGALRFGTATRRTAGSWLALAGGSLLACGLALDMVTLGTIQAVARNMHFGFDLSGWFFFWTTTLARLSSGAGLGLVMFALARRAGKVNAPDLRGRAQWLGVTLPALMVFVVWGRWALLKARFRFPIPTGLIVVFALFMGVVGLYILQRYLSVVYGLAGDAPNDPDDFDLPGPVDGDPDDKLTPRRDAPPEAASSPPGLY